MSEHVFFWVVSGYLVGKELGATIAIYMEWKYLKDQEKLELTDEVA